jgi:hypothetical protein
MWGMWGMWDRSLTELLSVSWRSEGAPHDKCHVGHVGHGQRSPVPHALQQHHLPFEMWHREINTTVKA